MIIMEKEKLLDYVAPCSLLCYACPSLKTGTVAECARKLHNYWEGFCEFRSKHLPEESRDKWHAEFNAFDNTLQFLGGASCPGCRNNPPSSKAGWGCLDGCVIPACAKAHGVDFCAECNDFPCREAKDFFATLGDDSITASWESETRRLREIGLEAYFEEKKDVSHYIRYKK